ncbi:hypothetical protein MKY34_17930 [Sporosarcina sp. FSL K6-1522]|uniref:hypothetical protein n=1 Tax=Sporosarcina sp. FSL K6-1522 TaxID=2921554 RepID=UPI00315A8732
MGKAWYSFTLTDVRTVFVGEFLEGIVLHPEYFSDANIKNLNNGWAIVNDVVFGINLPQYDVNGLRGKPVLHHHIGGGGQAMAISFRRISWFS